jgi:putative addiction module component (TIGR02574 family)
MVDRNVRALADQLLSLPSNDRARLAELLLARLEERDAGAAEAWDVEIDRRATDLESGQVAGVAAAEVIAEVERRLRR